MQDTAISFPPFPNSERVIYGRNPLIEVICQLRFPPILKIATEPPAQFQELIRAEYPLLSEVTPDMNLEVPAGIPASFAEIVKGTLNKRELLGYDFVSADEKWKVSLMRDFLSLSTGYYTRWEDFVERMQGPVRALIEVYQPAFFTRIGLRYQSLIQRSLLDLPAATGWSELIQPHMVGAHAIPELESSVEGFVGQLVISLPEFKGKVRVNYGVARKSDSGENCFLIDSDYHTGERTHYDAVDGILDYFNKQSGRLFRSCIQPRLHHAMDPHPVRT